MRSHSFASSNAANSSGVNRLLALFTTLALVFAGLFVATPAQAAPAVKYLPTSVTTNSTGTQVLLTYSVSLSTNFIPPSTEFTLTVGGVTRATTTYTPSIVANQIILTLNAPAIAYGQAATVSYTSSGAGNSNKIYRLGQTTDYVNNLPTTTITNLVSPPDTTPPTYTDLSTNTAGTVITMTYTEALLTTSVPAASAFTITQGGVAIPSTSYTVGISGTLVTLTFAVPTIENGMQVRLIYTPNGNSIKDLAGNPAAAIVSPGDVVSNHVPDTTAPRVDSRSTNTAGTVVTILFNEPLSTTNVPDPADFTLKVNTIAYPSASTTVSVHGSQVDLTLTGAPIAFGDALTLTYAHNTDPLKRIQDVAHNIGNPTTDQIVTNNVPDLGAPILLGRQTNTAGTQIVLTYSQPLDTASVPAASSYAVTVGGSAYTSFTAAVAGSTVTLTLTGAAITHVQIVNLSYTGTAVKRLSNGVAATTFTGLAVDNLVTPSDAPYVLYGETSVDGTLINITMSKPMNATSVPDPADFLIQFDHVNYAGTYTVSISGSVVTLHLSIPAVNRQYVEVSYTPGADAAKRLKDQIGLEAAAWIDLDVRNAVPDTTPPAVISRVTNATGTQIIVTFSEQLCESCIPLNSDLTIMVDGIRYDPANYTMSILGATYTFNLTGAPIAYGQSVHISYVPNADLPLKRVQDLAGNQLPPTTNAVVTNLVTNGGGGTPTVPTLIALDTDNVNGRNVFMTYDLTLSTTSVPSVNDFVLKINGVIYASTNLAVSISGSSVVLDLQLTGAAIKQGDLVTLAYTAGTAPIQDTAGHAAANLPQMVVANRVPDTTKPENISLTTNQIGSQLIWLYNEPLAVTRVPLPTDLVITVDGVVYSNTKYTVLVEDSRMVVTLTGDRIRYGDVVLLAYTPGLPGNQLADPAGNVIDSEPHATVVNMVSSTSVPTISGSVTNTNGTEVTITYNKALDAASVPAASDFFLTLDDLRVDPANYSVSVSGSSVTLRLATVTIANGVRVDLAYTRGLNPIKDTIGNYADNFAKTRISNLVPDTTPPVVIARQTNTDGTQVIITFSEPLDPAHVHPSADINLVFDGVRYDPSNYTISVVGSQIIVTLTGPAMRFGQVLRLSYTQNADTAVRAQDFAGNFAPNSVNQSIDNLVLDTAAPSVVSAVTNILGDKITLTYNYALNAGSVPTASNFVLHVGGSVYGNTQYSVAVSGSSVVLTLTGGPVANGQIVTLTYSGTALKRASNWVLAAQFANLNVVNHVPDTTPPVISLRTEVTVYVGSTAVTRATADDAVTWFEVLDAANLFAIDATTGQITISTLAAVGSYDLTIGATNAGGLESEASITVTVRPVPLVVSNGGVPESPLPPMATDGAPVSAVTSSIAETKLVATIQTSTGNRVVSVLEPAGGVPAGATITIKPGPVADESMDGRFTIRVDVTSPTGVDITSFDKVFTINMGQFVGGTLPAHSDDGKNWPVFPHLGSDWLPAGQLDGFYLDAQGNLIILTRHMTYFGLKKDQQLVHGLRILTGPTRMVTGGEFNFKTAGGLGAGKLSVESLTPELCSVQSDFSVHALKAGTCQIAAVKVGDGVYADAVSETTELQIEDPGTDMTVYGSIKNLRVDLGTPYAGKTVTIWMSTPADHPFKLYRKVTLDEMGVKVIRAAFDSHAKFRVLYGNNVIVNAVANH